MNGRELNRPCVDTIRTSAIDATRRAKAHQEHVTGDDARWLRFLAEWVSFDPRPPTLPNHDRFAPSADHASMLLLYYSA